MEDWEYHELLDAVKKDVKMYQNKGHNYEYSFDRTFREYEMVCNEGKLEDALVHLSLAEIAIEKGTIFIGYVNGTKKAFSELDDELLDRELTNDEKNDFLRRKAYVLEKLDTIKITTNPA